MDAEKVVKALAEGEFGDAIRDSLLAEMIRDLKSKDHDDDRAWADSTADWIWANWGGVDPDTI